MKKRPANRQAKTQRGVMKKKFEALISSGHFHYNFPERKGQKFEYQQSDQSD